MDAVANPDVLHPPKRVVMNQPSLVPQALKDMALNSSCNYLEFRRKDSKYFMKRDVLELASIIEHAKELYVIITHGTDSMVKNSQLLSTLLAHPIHKNIVFVGAMVPLANGMHQSDGYYNLEDTLKRIHTFPLGVHIAFKKQLYDPFFTRKNHSEFTFEHVLPNKEADASAIQLGRHTKHGVLEI